jgi:hypothetical protein
MRHSALSALLAHGILPPMAGGAIDTPPGSGGSRDFGLGASTAAPAPPASPSEAPPTPATGADSTPPEAVAAPGAPSSPATPAPTAPAAQPPVPEALVNDYAQLQQTTQYLGWLEAQYQQAAQADQQALNWLTQHAPADSVDAARSEYRAKEAERQAALSQINTARKEAALAEQALQLRYARHLMEGPSRQVLEHQHLSRAVAALPEIPPAQVAQELGKYLAKIDHPPSFEWATEQFIDLRRQVLSTQRQAAGIDQMGGGGTSSPGDATLRGFDRITRGLAQQLRNRT